MNYFIMVDKQFMQKIQLVIVQLMRKQLQIQYSFRGIFNLRFIKNITIYSLAFGYGYNIQLNLYLKVNVIGIIIVNIEKKTVMNWLFQLKSTYSKLCLVQRNIWKNIWKYV